MELNGQGKGVARPLDPLDHAIRRDGHDLEARRYRADGLVVEAVDGKLARSEDLSQPRFRLHNADRMRNGRPWLNSMDEGARDLAGNVLNQPAARRHVQALLSAADAEDGLLFFESPPREAQLRVVEGRIDGPEQRVGRFAIGRWLQIGPAGQEQPV